LMVEAIGDVVERMRSEVFEYIETI